jgi:hypothetical protein
MRKIHFSLGLNLVGCRKEETITVEDDATDKDIQEMYEDWRDEQLDGGWGEE